MNDHPPTSPIGPLSTGKAEAVSGEQRGSGEAVQPGVAGPASGDQRQHYRLAIAESASEARQGLGPLLAATGLIIWCISYFGFHNNMPLAVSGALYTIIPAVIGYVASHVTFKKVTL